jgi:UDP-N-acetylglucosamine--N-acetylmuramyl-(pentapeptide) pyrophosphoryl-undecaprenol N-acetylglucosamine transferase
MTSCEQQGSMTEKKPVLLAAGGTGGHLFPAQALAQALVARGVAVELATDRRVERYGTSFPARHIHFISSETIRARNPISMMRTAGLLGLGALQAWGLLSRTRPRAVVGFGGYPTIPPMWVAALRKIPTIIHEQNAVMGRANKLLAPRMSAIATSFAGVLDSAPSLRDKETKTGNPVRANVIAAAATPYSAEDGEGALRLVIFGGSQGARIMADILPPAIATLPSGLRMRLRVVQQAREEDVDRVRAGYAAAQVSAEVSPFFPDLPARIASATLVVARAGASTVAELTAIGRPAILVPLPHALDQDQSENAKVLEAAGGAIRMPQEIFTPDRLGQEIDMLASAPQKLLAMAAAARAQGALDAAERLADLVINLTTTAHA